MSTPSVEPHVLGHERFLDEVHSFEFWFHAVEGYLAGTDYGHAPDAETDPESVPNLDGLITTLCNYCIGEAAALEASSGMVGFAPNHRSKIFLATQVVDEARHLEVLLHRLRELGVEEPEEEIERRANPALVRFKDRLLGYVGARDWEAAVLAQNVVLEAMEFTVFGAHAERADPVTREVLEGIVKDERRHMGFGENDLGRRLQLAPHSRTRLSKIRQELDPLVLATFEDAMQQIQVPRDHRPELGRRYLGSIERLGLEI